MNDQFTYSYDDSGERLRHLEAYDPLAHRHVKMTCDAAPRDEADQPTVVVRPGPEADQMG